MKEVFKGYLMRILASKVVDTKVEEILATYNAIFPEEIVDIFIEEYRTSTGDQEYLSLFLFSEHYHIEIPNFMNPEEISIYPLKNQVDFLTITNHNYDFSENTTSKSELTVQYSLGLIGEFDIHATSKNCYYLKKIIDTYLKPNIFTR